MVAAAMSGRSPVTVSPGPTPFVNKMKWVKWLPVLSELNELNEKLREDTAEGGKEAFSSTPLWRLDAPLPPSHALVLCRLSLMSESSEGTAHVCFLLCAEEKPQTGNGSGAALLRAVQSQVELSVFRGPGLLRQPQILGAFNLEFGIAEGSVAPSPASGTTESGANGPEL